jgi:hypothetical protein
MDGTRQTSRIGILSLTALLWVGCSSVEVGYEPVPFELYDSPFIAGGTPRTEATPHIESAERSAETTSVDKKSVATEAPAPAEKKKETEAGKAARAPEKKENAETDEKKEAAPALSSTRKSSQTASTEAASADTSAKTSPAADAARYVSAIYELNDVAIPADAHSDIPALYRTCRDADGTFQDKEPAAGDLAFFHNVRDANGDGRNNDWYTHVALVEKLGKSGTVHLLGYRDGQVRSFVMNLASPDAARDQNGRKINDKLRPETENEPPYTRHLAGQLFAGWCAMLGDRSELLVVDNWQPGMDLEK